MIFNRILTFAAIVCIVSSTPGHASRRFGDVQNIGSRDILRQTSGFNDVLSIEKELSIGAAFVADFENHVRLISEPAVVDLISHVGQNLAQHSDVKMSCHFKIIDTDEMDVWAPLGGRIYINKGLITAAENEAELAAAMAHGIAHIAARHAGRFLEAAKVEATLKYISLPPLFIGRWSNLTNISVPRNLANLAGLAAAQRRFEEEADQLAVQYLWNTGYDPNAYITLLQKLQEREMALSRSGWRTSLMPATENRIAASVQERNQLPQKENYTVKTSRFDLAKALLLSLDDAQKADEEGTPEHKRPALRPRTEGERQESGRN